MVMNLDGSDIIVRQLKDGEDLDAEFSPSDPRLRECSKRQETKASSHHAQKAGRISATLGFAFSSPHKPLVPSYIQIRRKYLNIERACGLVQSFPFQPIHLTNEQTV
jgi:hypothetical protein